MKKTLFEGISTALITPFKNGKVDFDGLKKLIKHQMDGGVKTFVVLGTTAETSTLTFEEEDAIFEFVKKETKGKVTLIVGTGSNDTQTAIRRSIDAKNAGADGILVVTPYYNKATQKGLIAHYTQIAEAAKLPVILYNVPGRTGMEIAPETALELSKNQYIVGIKEASGNIAHITKLANMLEGKLDIYSGDDGLDYLFYALGAKGSISVTANVLPKQKNDMYNLFKKGDLKKALAIHNKLFEINKVLFCEVNPIPAKAACNIIGICSDEMRMPLTAMEPDNRKKLEQALKNVL